MGDIETLVAGANAANYWACLKRVPQPYAA